MKKIGLIGGTGPESTLIYYRELNRRLSQLDVGHEFPEMAIESVNLARITRMMEGKRYGELAEYLSGLMENLERSGAEVLALTAVTMHVVYDELKKSVFVPLIGIPETGAEYAARKGYRKVGLLGTIFTMEQDYLKQAFTKRGIEVAVPAKEERERVSRIIYTELEYGIVKEESREELLSVVRRMRREEGIEAVILGCTELPLALSSENCPVDCLDMMAIHIDELVHRTAGE